MRLKLTMAALLLAGSLTARNTITKVAKVSESVDVTGQIDYVITDAEPFDAMGSVNIQDTEHAVVIIQSQRPSEVIAKWLKGHVYIKGEQAVNGTNCQVKMYTRGAIIFPYDKNFQPLTCYTGENYEGNSYSNYTEGHSGGFMKTLNAQQLNNNIRSFKLKRGYMVTFAVGTAGWGYSRCFIADQEDLEVPVVPAPLGGKISSYRLFKWFNASKAGVHDTNINVHRALGTTSGFDWGQGNSTLLPDVEWVSHHIYEDWPSPATCGSVDGTCHMKTNNEPGNSADDHPQDVETVLKNWPNLMRTGLRLCSESSHDGSMNHLKTFMEEIDKRGLRCDILDLHCYWDGQFNSIDWYIQEYGKGRPCWISEWVWGSSWGHNGAFADGRQSDEATYNGTKPILDMLNKNDRVERYFYWNSEQWYTKIYRDGALTKLGQYYAKMDAPQGYNAKYDYAPKVAFSAPGELTGNFVKTTGKAVLSWSDPNGDLLDSIVVEYKAPGSTKYVKRDNVALKDQSEYNGAKYSYTTDIAGEGIHSFQITEYYTMGTAKRSFKTNSYDVTIAAANAVGSVQFGNLKLANTDATTTDLEPMDDAPYIVMGAISNQNTKNGITNHLMTVSTKNFKFRFYPWQLDTPVDFTKAENVDYLALPKDTVIHLDGGMTLISGTAGTIKGDYVHVTFPEAYPADVTPVVVAQQLNSTTTYAPVVVKINNVTNEGFDVRLVRQEGVTSTFQGQKVNYFACTPGQASIGGGKLLSAGRDEQSTVFSSSAKKIFFLSAQGDTLHLDNPCIIAAAQTNNYPAASVLRMSNVNLTSSAYSVADVDEEGRQISRSIKRQIDPKASTTAKNDATTGDIIGYLIISTDPNGSADDAPVIVPTGIDGISQNQGFVVSDGIIQGSNLHIYNAAGQQMPQGQQLPKGVYIVNGKKIILK